MSARTLTRPGAEMRDQLQRIVDDARLIRRRQRWPGATQADFASSVSVTATPNYTVVSPPDFTDPTFTTVASLTLDPGRWAFSAGCTVDANAPGFFFRYLAVMRVVHDGAVLQLTAAGSGGDGNFDEGFKDPLMVGATVLLDDEATVDLEVGYSHEKANNTGVSVSARAVFLIAIPA